MWWYMTVIRVAPPTGKDGWTVTPVIREGVGLDLLPSMTIKSKLCLMLFKHFIRGVYRLVKVDICTILVHIPMLEGKSSMGKFFKLLRWNFAPQPAVWKFSIFAL